jgi:putative NADH-flavin reductase
MKILLIGATGGTGQEILKQGLAQGHQITALLRNPTALTVQDKNLTVVQGDILKSDTLEKALPGQEAVISALGLTLAQSRKPTTIYSIGTKNLVEAMRRSQVRRLIAITGIGSGDSRGHGGFFYDKIILPFLLKEGYDDKTRQEEVIKASQLDWIIVRPGQLSNKPATGNYRIMLDGNYRVKGIARADVADFVLKQLTSNQYLRKTPSISY